VKDKVLVTKKELKEILKDTKEVSDTTQFTLDIEKKVDYWHIRG
jgi:hypothetical protein